MTLVSGSSGVAAQLRLLNISAVSRAELGGEPTPQHHREEGEDDEEEEEHNRKAANKHLYLDLGVFLCHIPEELFALSHVGVNKNTSAQITCVV